MATAPAANLADALNKTYRNVVGLSIGAAISYVGPLTIWRNEFFAALNTSEPTEHLIYRWIVPTNKLIDSLPPGADAYPESRQIVAPIAQLVQQTIYAARFNGFVPAAPLDAALTTAFNNAWT